MAKDSTVAKPKKAGGNKIVKWFRDLKSEIKKVVWPSKKQIINNTGIVLFVMVLTGLVLGGIDFGLSELISRVLLGVK